jgi:hypothetical protein
VVRDNEVCLLPCHWCFARVMVPGFVS